MTVPGEEECSDCVNIRKEANVAGAKGAWEVGLQGPGSSSKAL